MIVNDNAAYKGNGDQTVLHNGRLTNDTVYEYLTFSITLVNVVAKFDNDRLIGEEHVVFSF